jgi:hypothetical protein
MKLALALRSGYASDSAKSLAQRAAQLPLACDSEGRVGAGPCGDGGVARVDDRLQRPLLVGGVALDGFHDVGDQIVTALEQDVDLRPPRPHLLAQRDQPVV